MAKRPINYTSRILSQLKMTWKTMLNVIIQRHLSEPSFGALMLDMVAYVGDQLSFYADFKLTKVF